MSRSKRLAKKDRTSVGPRALRLNKTLSRLRGARLCYGEPVRRAGRTVIPVASVFASGGMGFGEQRPGESEQGESQGGGGGGIVKATPVGYIEVTEDGTHFRRIVTFADVLRLAGIAAGTAAAGAVAFKHLRG